eukprot:jgi/Chlat1/4829/Chrsp31S04867
MDYDEAWTESGEAQREVEYAVRACYSHLVRHPEAQSRIRLVRDKHAAYLLKGLKQLGSSYACLDASRTWLCYWILHALALLEVPLPESLRLNCLDFLKRCQSTRGGFGGGPGQLPHLATNYAAVCAILTLGGEDAYSMIDREAMHQYLLSLKDPSGGFRVHADGEIDVRGSFTAMAVAHLLNLKTPQLLQGVGEYIASCQTYEGGIGGEPGAEAHGGYTFCGLAAAVLAGTASRLNLPLLLNWAVHRQGAVEGGFQGRTNKLVDGCYSFWQGAIFAILQSLKGEMETQSTNLQQPVLEAASSVQSPKAEQEAIKQALAGPIAPALERATAAELFSEAPIARTHHQAELHVLSDGQEDNILGDDDDLFWLAGQHDADIETAAVDSTPSAGSEEQHWLTTWFDPMALQGYLLLCCQLPEGGLRDKPGKSRDYYHTCYCLSGLSVAQHMSEPPQVLGVSSNLLTATEPLSNIRLDRHQEAIAYFHQLPPVPTEPS